MERGIKDLSMFDLSCMKLIEIEVVEMFIEKLFWVGGRDLFVGGEFVW